MLLIIFCMVLIVFIYLKLKPSEYWKNKGIIYIKPWPIIGNMASILFKTQSLAHKIQDLYNAHQKQRYIGFYNFSTPTLLIRDPDLIKQVLIKDFEVFPEHQQLSPEGIDPLWDRNLFAMKGGEKWHDMRSLLSPTFTSSKMRAMFPLMRECAQQFTSYFMKKGGMVTVEMKDTCSRFTSDIIATTAFGITCNSIENRNNEVFKMGKEMNDVTGLRSLIFFLYSLSPTFMKLFKITIIKKEVATFFSKLIKETITHREEMQIIRPDVIHLLLEAKKGRLKYDDTENVDDSSFAVVEESELGKTQRKVKTEITNQDITAQAIIFFAAGFDTTSTLMTYICYELALNADCQKKLIEEVDQTFKNCNGEITYEALLKMKYLDMVVSETLRLWPPAEFTERVCVKNYTISAIFPNENSLHLEPGTNISIPIYGLHRDPQFYPKPDKFIPERFSDENKHNIQAFTYLPFGIGPRSCIGSRFALLETKLIIYEILCNFQIEVVEKTQIPLKLMKAGFGMISESGIWLGLRPRRV